MLSAGRLLYYDKDQSWQKSVEPIHAKVDCRWKISMQAILHDSIYLMLMPLWACWLHMRKAITSCAFNWQGRPGKLNKLICSKLCGYGPGPFFGEQLLKRGLSKRVGLVPCAVGGSSIEEWAKDRQLFAQMARFSTLVLVTNFKTWVTLHMRGVIQRIWHLQVEMTRRALESSNGGILKGMLWYQVGKTIFTCIRLASKISILLEV